MIYSKTKTLHASGRLLLPVLLMLLLVSAANAYTIIFRDGRRVEIPADFATTTTTLTYEVSEGIQITLQLAAIDIAATERANREPGGSLLRHSAKALSERKTDNSRRRVSQAAPRTITNRDLETFRRERVESEMLYERRRKELGLPSIEESRRRAAAEAEETFQTIREIRSRQEESETYWRTRASDLRADLASTNARIDFLQRRLNELSQPFSTGAFVGVSPFGTFARASVGNALRPPEVLNPGVFVAPTFGPQLTARGNFGNGMTRGQVLVNPEPFRGRRRFGGQSFFPFSGVTAVGLPFEAYDYSLERPALITERDQLLAYRAGLEARWRDLEDEARRAGVSPGWLRP
jgi:ABC-type multidrug transport system fused ATPase/permease subunit